MAGLSEIKIAGNLTTKLRNLVEAARPYNSVILLYEDDFSDRVLAAWAERDRLNLNTRKIGAMDNGVEVHTFGLDDFPPGTLVELSFREANLGARDYRRAAYKSLLNELMLISVRVSRKKVF